MTHRDRAGDRTGQRTGHRAGHRAGSREAAGDAGHRQGFPTPAGRRAPFDHVENRMLLVDEQRPAGPEQPRPCPREGAARGAGKWYAVRGFVTPDKATTWTKRDSRP